MKFLFGHDAVKRTQELAGKLVLMRISRRLATCEAVPM